MKKYYSKIKSFINEEVYPLKTKDIIVIGIIFLLYCLIAFYKLGDFKAPNTFVRGLYNEKETFEFRDKTFISQLKFFNGEKTSKFDIYTSKDGKKYKLLQQDVTSDAFKWNKIRIGEKCKSIEFIYKDDSSIGEIGFYDNAINYINYSANSSYFDDEKELIPDKISYMNSSYFDEVYFARSAYEYAHNMKIYEWTHPPLGKIIQAIPLFITGYFSPFLYRFMGTLAGSLMLIVMYFLGAYFFKKRGYAILTSLFLGVDTFHFAHTRMGTIDSHLVLFILLSFAFMLIYLNKDKKRYLFLSGLFFAFSIMTKWTGFYAGLGLAIIYFYNFIKNKKNIIQSLDRGAIFFVLIPIILYLSIYFVFPNNLVYTDNFDAVIEQQRQMYQYHSGLEDTHPFSSKWYSWPISYKPVWYHQQDVTETTEETISGVGNIFLWIGGILGLIYCIYLIKTKKDKNAFYIVIMILSIWLPYVFINRIMFLYHYFPVLPFLFISFVYLIKDLIEKYKLKVLVFIYLIFILLFSIIYYPIISGKEVPFDYADNLELFDSWSF